MEKFSFFDDENDDRIYYAEDFARHLRKYFTNGIFNNELQVVANNDMSVTVRPGDANIEGYRYTNTADLIKIIDVADGVLKRIDNVVIRWDLTNRTIFSFVQKGVFGDNPVPPEIIRSQTIYDLKLAEIHLEAGATAITQAMIVDTRFDEAVCGVVASAVQTLNTSDIYNQLYAKYEDYINVTKTSITDWFDSIKDILDNNNVSKVAEEVVTARNGSPTLFARLSDIDKNILNNANKISSLNLGGPLKANSMDDMIDITRIYVNIQDGKWYFYNENTLTWDVGGVYQAVEINNGSVTESKVSFKKNGDNILNCESYNYLEAYFYHNEPLSPQGNGATIYLPCDPNSSYEIYREVKTERLMAGYTTEEPALGVPVVVTHNNQHTKYDKTTISTGSDAKYIVIYCKHPNDVLTRDEIVKNLVISKNKFVVNNKYYSLDITNSDVANDSITPENTTFYKKSINEFDYKNCVCKYINRTENPAVFIQGDVTKYVIHKCKPNTKYTIYRDKIIGARFGVCYTNEEPALEVNYYGWVENLMGNKIEIITGDEAQYLCLYYYKIDLDGDYVREKDILDNIMIVEGDYNESKYIPHYILDVQKENLDSTLDCDFIDRFSSRNKIYGIKFDITNPNPDCERIANAKGLKNDFVYGNSFQLNNGVNDFDKIFPWCDIRICNLSFDANNNKNVTYQGEEGFTLDGTNGNVMVEIPKFYSMRERVGNEEIWAITGEPKSGFEVEPAFVVNGKELDYVYVSAYNSTTAKNGKYYSYTDSIPTTDKNQSSYINDFANVGLQSYDLSIFLLMQKLITIEFATRNVQKYFGGITHLLYNYNGNDENLIKDKGTNYVVINPTSTKAKNFYVGERVLVGGVEGSFANARYVTSVETLSNGNLKIGYDGADLSSELTVDSSGLWGCPQKNGLCDNLIYHTGRTDFGNEHMKTYVNPFRYRYIENVWGNVWEKITGFKIKNLKYYYSFIPNYNESINENSEWKTVNYDAPLQPLLGEKNKAWIVKNGYDRNNKLISFPSVVGEENDGGDNKYFSDCFYSKNESADKEYIACVGAGWDHTIYGGLFTLRAYLPLDNDEWLYGNRAIFRG